MNIYKEILITCYKFKNSRIYISWLTIVFPSSIVKDICEKLADDKLLYYCLGPYPYVESIQRNTDFDN